MSTETRRKCFLARPCPVASSLAPVVSLGNTRPILALDLGGFVTNHIESKHVFAPANTLRCTLFLFMVEHIAVTPQLRKNARDVRRVVTVVGQRETMMDERCA
jgi:hypothetical protein